MKAKAINKAKKNVWRFASIQAAHSAALIQKSIERHYGKQNKNPLWGKGMALARKILAECQPIIQARDKAEHALFNHHYND